MKKANLFNFYLPESRVRLKARQEFSKPPNIFEQQRHRNRSNLQIVIQAVVFWTFLLFTFRVGTIILVTFSALREDMYGLPVSVPNAYSTSLFIVYKAAKICTSMAQ